VAIVTPVLLVKVPFTINELDKVLVPLPEKVKLLKVFVPLSDCVVPLKLTVLVLVLNIPLFDQLPLTAKV